MSGFTKEIIAKTFTELLDEKPMSKITVKDIVERCGVNRRQTAASAGWRFIIILRIFRM